MPATQHVTDHVRDILADATIDGTHLTIATQLDRDDYIAVNKVLEALGGKWNRRLRAHVFPADPTADINRIIAGDDAPGHAKATEGFVATPPEVAEQIIKLHTNLHDARSPRVLEPSAGDGALVRAILAANHNARVTAIEPNAQRAAAIVGPNVRVLLSTFEEHAARNPEPSYDYAVMNPPFSVPSNRTIWIDHLQLPWELLAPGGRLVCIAPAGYEFRADRRHTHARDLINAHGGHARLTDDAFSDSTAKGIRTVLLWADKPA